MSEPTRRQFLAGTLALAALGTVGSAAAVPAAAVAENHPGVDPKEVKESEHSCDVLVIGGGMAGLFAAVKAADNGAKVMMAVKGRVGASGQTPWARQIFSWYPTPERMPLKEWLAEIRRLSERTCNSTFTRQLANHSLARVNELKEWGFFDSPLYHRCFDRQLKRRGVELFERLMITDLIKKDRRIIGAAGFAFDDATIHFFSAGSVILCTGAGAFKPAGMPVCDLTADGAMMAWRAGAKITGKEWNSTATGDLAHPAASWRRWRSALQKRPAICTTPPAPRNNLPLNYEVWREGALLDGKEQVQLFAEGPKIIEPVRQPAAADDSQQQVHSPMLTARPVEETVLSGGAGAGLAPPCCEGIVPVNDSGLSTLAGLYAAGDALGSYVNGAIELQQGASLAAAAVQGAVAGRAAALAAQKTAQHPVSPPEKQRLRKEIVAPLCRRRGFTPDWVTRTLQGIIIPNFVLYIKKEAMLKAALAYVEELRTNHQPRLIARDLHELRLAHETGNMLLNAEMKLRASLFRRESRCTHFRLDYPAAGSNWECWINIFQKKDGSIGFERQPFETWAKN